MRTKTLYITLLFVFAFMTRLPEALGQGDPDANLKKLGIVLPEMSRPVANYVKYVRTGNLVFLSGHGPRNARGEDITGKVGAELSIEQGYEAAKACGIQLLSTLKDACGGDLRKVNRIVKVLGMVNCTNGFTQQPAVMNGFSDLMVAVFGDAGKHARSAVGMHALPNNIAVEIEMVVELKD
jgi:enamine deaminase RidA (YjgF/YER057c/UK114 family)